MDDLQTISEARRTSEAAPDEAEISGRKRDIIDRAGGGNAASLDSARAHPGRRQRR